MPSLRAQALQAIATDDPTTEADNHHALSICAAGVVPHAVRLLSSSLDKEHTAAAALVAALAENPQCSQMLLGSGAVAPLVTLGRYGGDNVRRHALAALEILSLDAYAHESISAAGGKELLNGLSSFGGASMRETAKLMHSGFEHGSTQQVSIQPGGRARNARQSRLRHSKLWMNKRDDVVD